MINFTLYEHKSDDATYNAQQNLMGKTHYVDPDTLRFHKSRVLNTHITDNGLLFALIESCAADMHNSKRVFRYVIFDVMGCVITRPNLDDSWSTKDGAVKAMWEVLNGIDAKKDAIESIEREKTRAIQEADRLIEKVKAA